jgi:outer membrane protein assembly factor BamE
MRCIIPQSNDKSRMRSVVGIAALLLAVLASGCVYRLTVQQGNFLEKRAIDQLQVGMTRSQVRYLLGTPMMPPTFDNDRWDYLYYIKKGRISKAQERQLTVFFQNDKVARIASKGDLNSAPLPLEAPIRPIS